MDFILAIDTPYLRFYLFSFYILAKYNIILAISNVLPHHTCDYINILAIDTPYTSLSKLIFVSTKYN